VKVRARTGCEQASVNHCPERSCSIKGQLKEVTEEAGEENKWKKKNIVGEVRRGKCGKRDSSRKAAVRRPQSSCNHVVLNAI